MYEKKIWIILAAVLGTLVLALAAVFVLFCWKRSKRRVRGFSLRAVTPLDDAEFESWRRPSQYTKRPEKYGIRPTQPAVIRTTKTPNMFEKELGHFQPPRTPSPQDHDEVLLNDPSTPIRKPERVRRKSSVSSSIADRPPTPYSPASTSSEYPRSSFTSRKSYGTPRIHYPSMSEASAFHFDFNVDFDPNSPPRDAPVRPSTHSDRPLYLSYGGGPYPEKV